MVLCLVFPFNSFWGLGLRMYRSFYIDPAPPFDEPPFFFFLLFFLLLLLDFKESLEEEEFVGEESWSWVF
jgi:hypothetical protein